MEITKSFIALMNIRDKVVDAGIMNHNLSDGALEMMIENYGYTYTKNYLKGLL
jgi:hypothetical protein